MKDNTLPELDTSNLWDRVYALLKREIILRHYPPNEKLSLEKIADQLKVSRTPVRDALNRLEMDGLVVTRSKVGTFVVPIDMDIVNEVMDSRLMIERWVAEKLEAGPGENVREQISIMENIHLSTINTAAMAPEKYHEYDFNLQFHLAFVRLGGNDRNVKIYRDLMNYSLPATIPGKVASGEVEQAIMQHGLILKALKEQDYPLLKTVIQRHLEDSKQTILAKIEVNGGQI